jgi:hypothetical protein
MEAARLRDETAEQARDGGPTVGAEEAAEAVGVAMEDIPDMFSAAPKPATAEAERTVAEPAPSAPAAGEAAPGSKAVSGEPARPAVLETVICSLQGEVLYEWQSPDARSRVALLEFLTRRAGSMSTLLPLGQFDRLEAVEDGIRCILKMHEDQALFVRAQTGAPAA